MNLKTFGHRLRQARERKGITQEELVVRLGVKDAPTISEYENGRRKLAAYELPDFARALDIPVSFFFYDELHSDTDFDAAILEWFHSLPKQKRKWWIENLPKLEPFIIGASEEKKEKL
jgi:transcriptional regulator with XRE-family HTH domain